MAGIGVVFTRTLVEGEVTLYLTDAAAEAARDAYADDLTDAYRALHPEDPTGEYGERVDHPDGGKFAVMTADVPEFPGAPGYPEPPELLGQGAKIRWVGSDWEPPPP